MKKILILVFLLTFVIVPIALAQDNQLPQDLVDSVTVAIAAFGMLVANFLVTLIKSIPYFGNEDKDKLAQAVTEIVSVLVGAVTGYVLALLAQYLGLVEDSNLKLTVIALLTPVFNELRYRLKKLVPA